jgi:sigma-E factor negative regulatory protein RseB
MRRSAARSTLPALVAIGLGLGVAATSAAATSPSGDPSADSPMDWLARMSVALSEREYEGTLVYLHGHELSTLRIAHRIDNGEPRESLLALSGPIRAVTRSHQRVTCVLPDARAISVPRHSRGAAAALHPGALDLERLQPHYLIHPLGRSRVAGRDTRVIGIIPKDDLRYGYRFFIDEETGLPLKTDLMDSSATPIEQVMFTEVDFLDSSGAAVRSAAHGMRPDTPAADAAARAARDGGQPPTGGAAAGVEAGPWIFGDLPAGYRVEAADTTTADDPDAGVVRRWFMISDGLSSISVYIEPSRGQGLSGSKRVGAVNAAGRLLDSHQITAVGEAPMQTVEAIVDAISVEPDPAP